jgi:hypothetical protein
MQNRYRNLWHATLNIAKPPFYTNDAPEVFRFRDVIIYRLGDKSFDYVLSGACITQRAGFNASAARILIDSILGGTCPVSDVVAVHLRAQGFAPLTYSDHCAQHAASLK